MYKYIDIRKHLHHDISLGTLFFTKFTFKKLLL